MQNLGLNHLQWQVLGATFDGRYLAYRVDHSYSSFDDFTLYLWDSRSKARPIVLSEGQKDANGEFMPTPFVDPVLAGGWAYWTQTRDRDPTHTVLTRYRVSDGKREVLSRGFGRIPVRFDKYLVWSDSDHRNEVSSFRFLDLATGKLVEVPLSVRNARGLYYIGGDADTLTWITGRDGSELWAWRASWPIARLVANRLTNPSSPKIASDVIVFPQEDAMYAADLRSGSYTRVTPEFGSINADGGPMVVVGFNPSSKVGQSPQAVFDLRAVPPLPNGSC